jgi:hypothetical protein
MSKPLSPTTWSAPANRGRSGLGIDAQRAVVARFAEAEGFEIVAEHVEIETGKGPDALERRPQLAAALTEARRSGKACPIAVAKLDRLEGKAPLDLLSRFAHIAKVEQGQTRQHWQIT